MPTYKVGANRSLAIDDSAAWDGAAAKQRIWDWAGWKGNTAPGSDGGKTRQAFLVYDAGAADKKGSYHLPFADVKGGTLKALASGIRAAASRLPQMQGLPSAVQEEARGVLDAYEKRMNASKQKMLLFDAADRSRVDYPSDSALVSRIPPEEFEREQQALLDLLHAAVPDRSVLDEHPAYFWRMAISNDRVDSWGTQMAPSSLKNYAADATEGRAFLIGHDKRMAPVGYSLQGRHVAGQGGGVPRTEATFYTLRGLPDTEPVAVKLMGGLIRDASISFGGPDQRWICSIDGQDMLSASWEECGHIPGVWYRKDGKFGGRRGAKTEELIYCTARVEDAHMSETSGVYKGATPGAGVLKAQRAAEGGLLSANQRLFVEEHYRISLPGGRSYGLAGVPIPEDRMGDLNDRQGADDDADAENTTADGGEEGQRTTPAVVPQVVPALQPTVTMDDLSAACRDLGIDPGADPLAALRGAKDTVATMRSLAAAGTAYRKSLVDEALRHGVRAMGDSFNQEVWRAQLEGTRDVAALEAMRDNFASAAKQAVPAGRATRDDADRAADAPAYREYPASAYRS